MVKQVSVQFWVENLVGLFCLERGRGGGGGKKWRKERAERRKGIEREVRKEGE